MGDEPTADELTDDDAQIRCGEPDDLVRSPERRLRLTFALRKEDGGWVVAHEHHSFPIT
jgi:ketosteroid isomerase-like protein